MLDAFTRNAFSSPAGDRARHDNSALTGCKFNGAARRSKAVRDLLRYFVALRLTSRRPRWPPLSLTLRSLCSTSRFPRYSLKKFVISSHRTKRSLFCSGSTWIPSWSLQFQSEMGVEFGWTGLEKQQILRSHEVLGGTDLVGPELVRGAWPPDVWPRRAGRRD
jgi:hypothetical protein